MARYYSLVFMLLFVALNNFAQRTYFGFFPESAINYKFKTNWKLTGKIESQHFLFQNTSSQDNEWGYQHYRTDFQGFIARSITTRIKAAIGYQYRWDGQGDHSHRTIQQVGWLTDFRNYRIGHRIRTDQTFFDEGTSWRIRYRISSDLPLSGQQLDPGEKYVIISNEVIAEYLTAEYAIEDRLVAGLGWYFVNKHKLELSLDYRIDPLISGPQRQRIWSKISFYLNF